jgi:predicted DNA-binding protein with PD1-like motif
MIVKRLPKGYMLRLDQGEDLHQALDRFVLEHRIQSGHVSGIGMIRELELGFFDTEQADYIRHTYDEPMEVLSLSGTIDEWQEAPFFHIHGVFGRKDFSTVGGHVMKAVCDMTLEIFVADFETRMERSQDEVTGLKFLDFNR